MEVLYRKKNEELAIQKFLGISHLLLMDGKCVGKAIIDIHDSIVGKIASFKIMLKPKYNNKLKGFLSGLTGLAEKNKCRHIIFYDICKNKSLSRWAEKNNFQKKLEKEATINYARNIPIRKF